MTAGTSPFELPELELEEALARDIPTVYLDRAGDAQHVAQAVATGDVFTHLRAQHANTAEVLRTLVDEIDRSPAVLWLGRGGARERVLDRLAVLERGGGRA